VIPALRVAETEDHKFEASLQYTARDCLKKKKNKMHGWWECKLVQPLWKTAWKLLKKLKIELSYDPAIPLLGVSQRNLSQVTIKTSAHPCLLQHYS
jgi:hypothetical protein